jgi:hypothetical protein
MNKHYNNMQKHFINGKPPHLLGEHHLLFTVLTENAWSQMSSAQVQEMLKTCVIIILNDAAPPSSFDRELFVDMLGHGDMQYVVNIEGEVFCHSRPFMFMNWQSRLVCGGGWQGYSWNNAVSAE